VGGLGVAGLALPDLLQGRAAVRSAPMTIANSFGRARSCILCFLFGAPAHQDIWDLKPDAPSDVRGEFRPIGSSVPASCSASISRSQPIAPIALPWFDPFTSGQHATRWQCTTC